MMIGDLYIFTIHDCLDFAETIGPLQSIHSAVEYLGDLALFRDIGVFVVRVSRECKTAFSILVPSPLREMTKTDMLTVDEDFQSVSDENDLFVAQSLGQWIDLYTFKGILRFDFVLIELFNRSIMIAPEIVEGFEAKAAQKVRRIFSLVRIEIEITEKEDSIGRFYHGVPIVDQSIIVFANRVESARLHDEGFVVIGVEV